jgi:hypothetical protein
MADRVLLDSNFSILPHSAFYTDGKWTSYHVDTNISHHRQFGLPYEKETNPDPPPPPLCDTSQLYLQHLSMCDYRTKIRSNCPLSDSFSNAEEFLVNVTLSKLNCLKAVIIQIWRLLFAWEHSILRFGERIEACKSCDTVVSCYWTVFIIWISNTLFNI